MRSVVRQLGPREKSAKLECVTVAEDIKHEDLVVTAPKNTNLEVEKVDEKLNTAGGFAMPKLWDGIDENNRDLGSDMH